MFLNRWSRLAGAAVLILGVSACNDFLEVADPSRFTDADLDNALQAVVNGVEGDLHLELDARINDAEIMSDVMQHTGTWAGWDDTDHGLVDYNNSGRSNGGSTLLQTRFAAQDALARFDRLEGEGRTIDATYRPIVQTVEGWSNLLLAQWFCEAPDDPTVDANGTPIGGPALTDMQVWAKARDELATALASAQGAGATDYARWAQAGLARAELMLGNFDAARTNAEAIPDGWEKLALYQVSTADNAIVQLSTIGFNNASGIREKWWPLVDDAARLMRDPLTNELDPRVPIRHDAGVLGVDGVTEFYSQWKYQTPDDDIAFTHSEEMRLIEAEVAWRQDRLTDAMTLLNGLRTAAGLTPVTATTSQEVFDVLLNERFAELFMEGHRANDLVRFDLVQQLQDAGDFVGSVENRTVKFSLSQNEAINNPNIEDNAAMRCSPKG